jgi:hypothetical protein
MSVLRPFLFEDGLRTLRNGQELWTVGKFHSIHDQPSETFAKSRSRFKNERTTVLIYVTGSLWKEVTRKTRDHHLYPLIWILNLLFESEIRILI